MNNLADFGGPFVGVGILLVVAVALALVLRRRARARAMRPPPPPDPAPAETEATFLDSSHIIDGPIIGRAPERLPPVEPDRTGKR
jgi:hypothetical protein